MTASATILTAEKSDVLLVPNSALRFTPRAEKAAPSGMSAMMMRGPHDGGTKSAKDVTQHGETERTVYVLRNGQAVPVQVTTGLTDGARTEIVSGELAEGDAVVVDQRRAAAK